jgi:hypothetical protein
MIDAWMFEDAKIEVGHYPPWFKTRQDALDKVLERVAVEEPA